ncbi:hypothetical protein M514_09904 [Trichuris suis]|uniref:Uncharacterized protein n=1 Tax=Trichuris suis TaxID=68888 RepID=A0A085N4E2_9BILA|nr:hypothetical protein M513_09904 [Trichuris suis]KFD64338.1 hypothetical protein M514_09904 [Trichuris suis]
MDDLNDNQLIVSCASEGNPSQERPPTHLSPEETQQLDDVIARLAYQPVAGSGIFAIPHWEEISQRFQAPNPTSHGILNPGGYEVSKHGPAQDAVAACEPNLLTRRLRSLNDFPGGTLGRRWATWKEYRFAADLCPRSISCTLAATCSCQESQTSFSTNLLPYVISYYELKTGTDVSRMLRE